MRTISRPRKTENGPEKNKQQPRPIKNLRKRLYYTTMYEKTSFRETRITFMNDRA